MGNLQLKKINLEQYGKRTANYRSPRIDIDRYIQTDL